MGKTLADEWRVYAAMPRFVVDAENETIAECKTPAIAAEIARAHNRQILNEVKTRGMLLDGVCCGA